MVATIGHSSSRDGRSCLILSVRRKNEAAPQICFQVATDKHNPDSATLDETQCFERSLWEARNAWDVERRRGGLFGHRFIRRADADAALKRALADLSAGGGR